MWLAYFELNTNLISDAKTHFLEIISLKESNTNKTNNDWQVLFTAYLNLSDIYNGEGNYNKAFTFKLKFIDVLENKLKLPNSTLAINYQDMVSFCVHNNDTLSAKLFFDKSLNLFFYCYDFYFYKRNFAEADEYLNKAILANASINLQYTNQIKHRQAKLNISKAQRAKAIDILSELLSKSNKNNAEEKTEITSLYIDLSKTLFLEKKWDSALENAQNALISASIGFNKTDIKTNPSVSDAISKRELLNILNLKSEILLQLAQTNPDNYLQPAFETAQLGITLMDSIRVDYSSDYDKINLVANAYSIFEKYIKSAYLLHQKTQNPSYIVAAYQAVEQSKALVLLEGLKGIEAETVLSEADRQSLFQLKAELIALEKKRNDEKNQDLSNANYIKIQNQIFDANRQFDNLIKIFETRYPAYFKLKFDRQLTNIKQTQEMLTANQTLVNYFVGDSSIFVFLIKSNNHELIEIKKDFPLDNWVELLRGSLSADNYQNQADIYADMAFKLYEKLIKPIKAQLTEEITIIPDGILGYIPFEALLTKAPEKAFRFQTHGYLLREHAINYSFSATLLREMINKKHAINPNKNIITYAPFFNGNTSQLDSIYTNDLTLRKDFAPLSNSGEEAYSIAKLMGGEAIIGKDATDSSFIKNAPSARMLLLATHGKANDKSSDYSYLAFSSQNDSLKNALFYVRDLYNLTLNADLVVLSACETGIGKLKRGEGIISLARAFAYAGAKSIVTSLWSVNDAKTKDLMLFFFKNLKKGKSKDAALREAKLTLMKQKDHPNAHPFFWAGFIGMGDRTEMR
jgi:CHAT domain-containing protein